jgi:hypothetical protein
MRNLFMLEGYFTESNTAWLSTVARLLVSFVFIGLLVKLSWPNGPLISQKTTRSLAGSYGLFIKIKEFRSTDISEIKKVILDNI